MINKNTPTDWKCESLKYKIEIIHGFGFKSEFFKSFGIYSLTTPGNFYEEGGFKKLDDKQKFYDGPVSSYYILKTGDMIIAMTEQSEGLLGSAAIIPKTDTYLHNQRLGKIKQITNEIDLDYLYWIFNSEQFRLHVTDTSVGTKVKHTSPTKLLDIPVTFPTQIDEQSKISTLLFDMNDLIQKLNKLIEKKKNVKQSLMNEFLTGNRRISGFNKKWKFIPLGKLCELKKGEMITRREQKSGTIPVIAGGTEPSFFHNKANRMNKTITISASGTSGYVQFHSKPIFASDCHTIEENGSFSIEFLYYVLLLKQQEIYGLRVGHAPSHVRPTELNLLELTIPNDLFEQLTLSKIFLEIDLELIKLKQQAKKYEMIKKGMMQKLLTGEIRIK
jgi:type I restriction enzyme, S subunit